VTGERGQGSGAGRLPGVFVYTGQSMYPTFRDHDIVIWSAPENRRLRRGDVVLFRSPNDGRWIVHRIYDVSGTALTTRGDANRSVDEKVIAIDTVEGRVIAVERAGRRIRVPGGWIGHWSGVFLRKYQRWRCLLRHILWCLCRPLTPRSTLQRLFSPLIRVRVVEFKKMDGTELQLFFGRRRIGLLRSADQKWRLSPPFSLILDPDSLPCPLKDGA